MARPYSYASAPDVLAHLTFIATFTATSRPNASQVHHFLYDTAQDLDTALAAQGYSTPISTGATLAFGQLNSWNSVGAAMFAGNAMPQGGDGKHVAFLERRWDAILSGIRDGELRLPDAGKDTTSGLPRYGGQATATFTREDEP